MKQARFRFRKWGGKRKGSGRKPNGPRARLRHVRRPALKARFPVHVTWRMRQGVWNLRTHERALAKGMCELGVRVARGLNRVMNRKGAVFDDRYHGHILRTATEVRRARNYLLQNAPEHYGSSCRTRTPRRWR